MQGVRAILADALPNSTAETMPSFDSGARFDSNLFYDAGPMPPLIPKPKRMAKPKLELRRKTDPELENFSQSIVAAMTGNPNFPTPTPTLASVTAAIDAYSTTLQTIAARQAALREAFTLKDTARAALEQQLTFLANYVEIATQGSEAGIESAGMGVRNPPTPVGTPGMVMNLAPTAGDFPGTVDLTWDPTTGASSYEVQCKLHEDAAQWSTFKIVTASRIEVDGLTPGLLYAFQVRAIASAGSGPWSDVAVKRAP
jgi:hypothetical protein